MTLHNNVPICVAMREMTFNQDIKALLSSRAPVGYLAIAAMPVAINQGFIAMKCNERAQTSS